MKISLAAAIAFMNTAYAKGNLNVFSVGFRKLNGEYCEKKAVCKVNLDDVDTEVANIVDKASPKLVKSKGLYSVMENRIVRLYDMEKQHNFSLKIDLLCKVNDLIVDHEPH